MALQWVYIARLSWPPQSSLRLRAACFPPPAPMQSPDGQTEQGRHTFRTTSWFLLRLVAASYRVLQVFTKDCEAHSGSSSKLCCCGARTDERVRYAETARCAPGLQGAAGLPWTSLLACAKGSSSALPEGGGCKRRKGRVDRRVCHAYCQRFSIAC